MCVRTFERKALAVEFDLDGRRAPVEAYASFRIVLLNASRVLYLGIGSRNGFGFADAHGKGGCNYK